MDQECSANGPLVSLDVRRPPDQLCLHVHFSMERKYSGLVASIRSFPSSPTFWKLRAKRSLPCRRGAILHVARAFVRPLAALDLFWAGDGPTRRVGDPPASLDVRRDCSCLGSFTSSARNQEID